MKINYLYTDIVQICGGQLLQEGEQKRVESIQYDSRKISYGDNCIFLCLRSDHRDGHLYVAQAYEKGVRIFLVDQTISLSEIPNSTVIHVGNVLVALQKWAQHHRQQFDIPVIGITGSAGKTIVKEWLYHVISPFYVVSRSPKSFNSQLGVALSLFEIHAETQIALIEAGISEKGEMTLLQEMIQPNWGVFTSFLSTHRENFTSEKEHWAEKCSLFKNCSKVFVAGNIAEMELGNTEIVRAPMAENYEDRNRALVQLVAQHFGLSYENIDERLRTLPRIALRMETFEGLHDNTLLFDAYNLSLDGLEQVLAYQKAVAEEKNRYLVLANEALSKFDSSLFTQLMHRFQLEKCALDIPQIVVFGSQNTANFEEIEHSSILFKGAQAELKRLANSLKSRKHITSVDISMRALKNNLKVWRSRIPKTSQIMAMVKASAYGSELTKIASLLAQEGVTYLGVAYVDEGIELRKTGIQLPILVMNSDRSSWADCVKYQLEPAVFSFEQMEALVKELILLETTDFPVHLKFDTGMRRLGFFPSELPAVLDFLRAQPELKVKSVYSHLADADNLESSDFTLQQLKSFQNLAENLQKNLPYPILRHILNSDGLSHYAAYSFDMVRLGIGIYGLTSNPELAQKLEAVLSWKSQISQIKTLRAGETLGYGRSFKTEKDLQYAIIPVGYADGFRRELGNGKGGVYIHSAFCPTLGRVCMDMIMVDLGTGQFQVGDEVEIIGDHQHITQLANECNTIPYEIMTGLSLRMPRVFVEEGD